MYGRVSGRVRMFRGGISVRVCGVNMCVCVCVCVCVFACEDIRV